MEMSMFSSDTKKEKRHKQRLSSFDSAVCNLEKYAKHPLDDELSRAGFIQLFEIAVELFWKTLKDYLETQEVIVNTPKETLRSAFKCGLLCEGETALDMLQARNQTSHVYSEDISDSVLYNIQAKYVKVLRANLDLQKRKLTGETDG